MLRELVLLSTHLARTPTSHNADARSPRPEPLVRGGPSTQPSQTAMLNQQAMPSTEVERLEDPAHRQLPVLEDIARKYLGVVSLAVRNSDAHDFHDLAVWRISDALAAAYAAGQAAAQAAPGNAAVPVALSSSPP